MLPYPSSVSAPVAELLSLVGNSRLPLTRAAWQKNTTLESLHNAPAAQLFPGARDPGAALSGLLLRIGHWEESHEAAQDLSTREGDYWHAMVHRMEPDFANSRYWYRRVGWHPIFLDLRTQAVGILTSYPEAPFSWPSSWDPDLLNRLCEEAIQSPGTWKENVALAVHTAEWELLFRWCISG